MILPEIDMSKYADKEPKHEIGSYRIREDGRGFTVQRYMQRTFRKLVPHFIIFTKKIEWTYYGWMYEVRHSKLGLVAMEFDTLQQAKDFIDRQIERGYKNSNPEYTYYPPKEKEKRKPMISYKFRAECMADIQRFTEKIRADYHVLTDSPHPKPDIEAELTTTLTLSEIITIMKTIEDGHVMWQTIQPIADYTGERNYSI